MLDGMTSKSGPNFFFIFFGHRFIEFPGATFSVLAVDPLEEICSSFVPCIPTLPWRAFPVGRSKAMTQPNVIGNSLNETSWATATSIVLEAMHHFVEKDTFYLVGHTTLINVAKVIRAQMYFFVVII